MVNENFARIVPSEFIMITVVMCYNLIQMALTSSTTASYIQNVMVIASTLAPIFYYCWFGNEVKLKVTCNFNFVTNNHMERFTQ